MTKVRGALAKTALLSTALVIAACGGGPSDEADTAGGGGGGCDTDTVKILVSSEAGSPVDTMARAVAEALEETGFEPSVVIETRTGGSGAVALSALVGAPADGSTLYAMTRSQAVLFAGGQIDAFEPDALEYLTRLQDDPYIWAVQADSEFQTLDDLIAYAEDNPGALTVGGFGAGSAHHLAALRIAQEAGIEINWVPFDGGSEAVTALLGGFIEVANTNPGQVLEQVRAGEIRVLGVASEEPVEGLPDTPTFQDAGVDYVGSHWRGIVAKAGMPEECAKSLEAALAEAYESESFQDLLVQQNVNAGWMDSEEFGPYVLEDIQTSEGLLAEAGIS